MGTLSGGELILIWVPIKGMRVSSVLYSCVVAYLWVEGMIEGVIFSILGPDPILV